MFDWLRRLFWSPEETERHDFLEQIDALNVKAGGGKPQVEEVRAGKIRIYSGDFLLGDPQGFPEPAFELPNVAACEAEISLSVWRYPSGATQVNRLTVHLTNGTACDHAEKIGEVGIDSAKMILADKADIERHWTEVGKDRVGVISTAPDDTVLQLLTKRFKLKTVQRNVVRAVIVGRVSESLEGEIESFLKSQPEYADYPFLYFRVETNNSFERSIYLSKAWDFIPVGNAATPLMFVCGTGRGDGVYEVKCSYDGDVPQTLSIDFMGE